MNSERGFLPSVIMREEMGAHYLEWRQGGRPRRMALRKKELFIGRRSDSDIVLTDPYVSRRHARLLQQDRVYKVIDLNSTHGTFVNGNRVRERVLEAGDKIRMGPGPSEFNYTGLAEQAGSRTLNLEQSVLQLSSVLPPVASAASELEKISHILDFQYQWGRTFSADRMLGQLLESALRVSGAERGFLLTLTGQRFDYVVGMDHRGERLSESEFSTSHTVVEQVAEQGEPLLMTEGIDQQFASQESIVNMRLRAVACMPLKWISGDGDRPSVRGILYLDSRKAMHMLSGLDQKILTRLALEASNVFEKLGLIQSLEERKRVQQELALAQATQRALLPQDLPHSRSFSVHASSTPTRYVGGDYYDFLDPDNEDLTGVLADVSGKGVPAALLSSFLQGVLEVGFGSSLSLGEAVTGANNHLFQKTPSNRFVTLFLFRVNPSGEGEYVSAGHNPAYVCRAATGGIDELVPCGMILGAFEDVVYESVPFRLNVGDILVVYSDGVTEAMDPNGEMFGETRLMDVVRESAASGGAAVQDAILAAVRSFMGKASAYDDLTVLVVERLDAGNA